jgi:hypothetical protein
LGLIKRISRYLLGIDDTETSNQEIFIKDFYNSQKNLFRNIDKTHIASFIDTLLKKHDLIYFGLVSNRKILLSSEEKVNKEILNYFDIFETIKGNLKEKIVLLKENPWIGMFEKENYVFVTKRETKLSEMEINAIAHDVLNSKEMYNTEEPIKSLNVQKAIIKKSAG